MNKSRETFNVTCFSQNGNAIHFDDPTTRSTLWIDSVSRFKDKFGEFENA